MLESAKQERLLTNLFRTLVRRYSNNGCYITKLGLCSKSHGSSFNLSDYFVTSDLQGVLSSGLYQTVEDE